MNTPVTDDRLEDDRFEGELRRLLQSATSTLEPHLTLDDLASWQFGDQSGRRTWARAGAVGLTAAAAVGSLVWLGGDEAPRVSSPSTPSTASDIGQIDPAIRPDVEAGATTTPDAISAAAFDPINLLVVGLDRRVDCFGPGSPYDGSFPTDDIGARGDTIMVLRLDPTNGTASVLSFPRDLWVTIPNREGRNRLNAAVIENDPTRLLGTLYNEFGVEVDHFLQLDYCGVTALVDAVGGVDVPFATSARDENTGLSITEPGCARLDGPTALAYLRSRRFEVLQPDGTWQTDPLSDLGRISRQQDFLLRLLEEWRQLGPTDVEAARALITTMQEHVVVDTGLTIDRMLDIAGFVTTLDRDDVRSFTVEGTAANVGGQTVLIPKIEGDNMQAVLALFRGDTVWAPSDGNDTTSPADPASATVLEAVVPEENPMGIVPPRDITC